MRLNPNVIRLESTKGSWCYLVKGEDGWSLIDTGFSYMGRRILQELSKLGIRLEEVKDILLTHHDVDHVGNVKRLQERTGAIVWAHAADIPYITGEKERYGFKKWIGRLAARGRITQIRPYPPDGTVGPLTILPTPGHTPGHVCILGEGILFAGDLVKSAKGGLTPYPSPWNWDGEMLRGSILELEGIRFAMVCPAHGEPVRTSTLPLWENR